MRADRKTRLAKLALALFATLLTLVALEIGFRCAGIRAVSHLPYNEQFYMARGGNPQTPPNEYGIVPGTFLRITYDSNPRGYFEAGNYIDHLFNSRGWRDREHAAEKPTETFRILGLGDSYLFGQGVKYEDVCLTQLGKLLQSDLGDRQVETINTGLQALNTAQERDILEKHGLQYDPDLVILHFVLNDVERRKDLFQTGPKVEFTEEYVKIYQSPGSLSKFSYFGGWAKQQWQRYWLGESYIRECVQSFTDDSTKWQQCRTALDDIHRICQEHDIPLLVVIFPFFHNLDGEYPFAPIHEVVRTHCESQQIPVLDLREKYREFHGPELWVHPTDQHPNETAHKIAAETIAETLGENSAQFLPQRLGERSSKPLSD